jgi:hypothetical protein
MSHTLYKTVNFGPGRGGLSTVGYTLTGGSRITAGVAEVGTATGIYGATVTFADGFAGAILWDTGQGGSTVYAAEEVNPNVLAPAGLDAVPVETGVNARQALSPILAASAGVLSGAGSGTIVIRGGNVATTRITATTDNAGNRTVVTLALPG